MHRIIHTYHIHPFFLDEIIKQELSGRASTSQKFRNIIEKFRLEALKTYEADAGFVAITLAAEIEAISLDSDVISLSMLHVSRKVA